MSEFTISSGAHLSIDDLKNLLASGHYVARTGHLGNQYFSNMLLHALGIPGNGYDRNMLLTDVNYHPSCIIQNGQRLLIAERDDVIVPFAKLGADASNLTSFVDGKSNPGQVHHASLIKLFGSGLIRSETEFICQDQEMLEKVIDLIAAVHPELFLRRSDAAGKTFLDKIMPTKVTQKVMKFNQAILEKLSSGIGDPSEGVIPSMEAVLVIVAVMGAYLTGKDKLFEISGPAMINYSQKSKFMGKVNSIYGTVRKEILELPEKIELSVVPSFYFRFGSLASEKREMDHLWENLKRFPLIAKKKEDDLKLCFTSGLLPAKAHLRRKEIWADYKNEFNALAQETLSASQIVERMDFSEKDSTKMPSLKPIFFSQYDLLEAGESLYVPEEVLYLSMGEMAKYYGLLSAAKKQLS